MAPRKPRQSERALFERRMRTICVFPLFVNLIYRGKEELIQIDDDLTINCDGHKAYLYDFITEFIRFQNWQMDADEREPEPLTVQKAMELLFVPYLPEYSLWTMYMTETPITSIFSPQQRECYEKLAYVPFHSFRYQGVKITIQPNRLFSCGISDNLTGADVIYIITGQHLSETDAHVLLFP